MLHASQANLFLQEFRNPEQIQQRSDILPVGIVRTLRNKAHIEHMYKGLLLPVIL